MTLLTTILFTAAVTAKCYEPTTAHPLPDLDTNDPLLKQAFVSIQASLDKIVATSDFDSSSFSVEITSSKNSLWSHHHTARERNASRPDIPEVGGDALYRIASITKTFTVLGILYEHEAGNLHLDDSIDKYIKELKEDQSGTLPWKDITLRSLASQLSGIPREFAQCDMINDQFDERDPVDLGLPPMSRHGLPKCDEYSPGYETPCTAHDLLKAVMSQRPLFAPNMKSSYSNTAFELLGLVLSRVSGKSYKSYIQDEIFKPIGMSKSSIATPPDSSGVIPTNPQYWDVDQGIQIPTGGIYSSTTDLSKYLRYILTHYNAVATGVNWFHLGSAAGGVNGFYGMPWEIFHTDRILKGSQRPVRFITKGGGLPGYTSVIILAPEYGLGITILLAGDSKRFLQIQETVTTAIIRAAEAVAIRQLKARYVGTYAIEENSSSSLDGSNGDTRHSELVIEADERGLVVTRFISNNTDVLKDGFKRSPTTDNWYAQLLPTLLYKDEKNQQGELWRMLAIDERSETLGGVWDDFCVTDYDHPLYAGVPFNEAIFEDEKDGRYDTVELSGFRKKLTRQSEDKYIEEIQEALEL